jgi:hypothetical protein
MLTMKSTRKWLAAALTAVLVASMGLVSASPATSVSYGLKASVKYTAVHLLWTSQGAGKTYEVQYGTSKSFKGARTIEVPNTGTYVNELAGKKTYYFRVRTKGTSSWSPKVSKKTSYLGTYNGTKVEKATKVSTDDVSGSSIELTWTTPSGQYACFRVKVSPTPKTGQPAIQCTTAFTLTGLSKSTKYGITLYTVAPASGGWPAVNISGGTKTIYRTTSSYTLAGPGDLKLVPPQHTWQAKVDWTAPTNPAPAATDSYRILLGDNSAMKNARWYKDITQDTKLTMSGLSSSKIYYARVVVVDTATLKQRSDRSGYLLVKTLITHGSLTGSVSTSAPLRDLVADAYNSAGELADQADIKSDGSYVLNVRPTNTGSTPEVYKVRIAYIGDGNFASSWVSTKASPAVNPSQATAYQVGNEGNTDLPSTKIAAGHVITGNVVDAKGGKAVSGALVTLQNIDGPKQLIASAYSSGTFSFKGVPSGSYTLRASYVGSSTYKAINTNVVITDNHAFTIKLPRK